ncbi:MAG: ribosome maturation factor RimP [Gemmatimonadota bacterium]
MGQRSFEQELAHRVEEMGYEFVTLDRTGSKARPIFRLRIDRPEAEADGRGGVSLDDCARVSRRLEAYLDEHPEFGGRYVLEVSSPGVERPLVRPRDFERFGGRRIAVKGYAPLAGRTQRLEGELLGLVEADGEERVRLRLDDGDVVEIPRARIAQAHLVFRWEDAS